LHVREQLQQSAVIVFDFDKTLTEKDTVFGFFWHASQPGVRRVLSAFIYWFRIVCAKLGVTTLERAKAYGVRKFLGQLTEAELDVAAASYAKSIVLNWLYREDFQLYSEQAWVVSASPQSYLKYLFNPERLLATELSFDGNGHPSGIRRHCHGQQKVEMLRAIGITRIDRLYTDNKSDSPLAQIADETYFISGETIEKVDRL